MSLTLTYFTFQYMIVMIIIVILEVIAGLLAFAFWPEVLKSNYIIKLSLLQNDPQV